MAENTEINNEPIEVIAAKTLDDMKMRLTFANNETRLFDANILDGPAFEPLKNKEIFKDCTIVDGIVTWLDEEIDCAPEYMYLNSKTIDKCRKENDPAFALNTQKTDAFLHRKVPKATDAIARFEKRKRKGGK